MKNGILGVLCFDLTPTPTLFICSLKSLVSHRFSGPGRRSQTWPERHRCFWRHRALWPVQGHPAHATALIVTKGDFPAPSNQPPSPTPAVLSRSPCRRVSLLNVTFQIRILCICP